MNHRASLDSLERGRVAKTLVFSLIMKSVKSPPRLVLQRILELQEQAPVPDDALAFLQSVLHQGSAILGVADLDETPSEFVGVGLHIDERRVFRVAQHGGIWNSQRIGKRARVNV